MMTMRIRFAVLTTVLITACLALDRPICSGAEHDARVAKLTLEKALYLCESQRVDEGLLWMGRALKWAPADSPIAEAIRLNIAAWKREAITSVGGLPGPYRQMFALSQEGRWLAVTKDDKSIEIFDSATWQRQDRSFPVDGSPVKLVIYQFLRASNFAVATCCPLPEYLRLVCGRLGPRVFF